MERCQAQLSFHAKSSEMEAWYVDEEGLCRHVTDSTQFTVWVSADGSTRVRSGNGERTKLVECTEDVLDKRE